MVGSSCVPSPNPGYHQKVWRKYMFFNKWPVGWVFPSKTTYSGHFLKLHLINTTLVGLLCCIHWVMLSSGLDQPSFVRMRSWVYHPRVFLALFLWIVSLLRITLETKMSCMPGMTGARNKVPDINCYSMACFFKQILLTPLLVESCFLKNSNQLIPGMSSLCPHVVDFLWN